MNLLLLVLICLMVFCVIAVTVLLMTTNEGTKYKNQYGSLEHLKALVADEERQLKELKDRREEYDRAIKFLDERPELEAEKEKLISFVSNKEQTLAELTERKEKLEESVGRLSDILEQVTALEKENESLKGDVARKTDDKRSLEAAVAKLEEERVNMLAEQQQVKMDIAAKESRYKTLSEEVDNLQEKKEKLEVAVKALVDIERELAIGRADKEMLQQENLSLAAKNKSLVEDNATLESQKANLSSEMSGLESRKTNAERWLNDHASDLEHMKDLEQEIARREKDCEAVGKRFEEARKNLDETLRTVEKSIDRLTKMNLSGVQTLRLSSFESLKNGEGAFALPDRNGCDTAFGEGDEAKALNAVSQHFKDKGFDVPDRLLYAFHTSLKTSDMSSLTVMAGVSGTGKSAIPKLYAEAMGIFFSPLAVEPRWDSPKDLMGFFNYVTNRYEPTPLARAMFQFQGLWDDNFKPECALDQYMFMPMLDEMNLARIEYYFSEFLSKLEMRRLVGELAVENVSSVALEVFPGFKGVVEGTEVWEKPLRIFANTNTLFVGTMNEDETTQSLSDKVIDRANVLYFGKPRELRPPANDNPAEGMARQRFPLTHGVWTKWCKTVDQGALAGPIEVLTNLNERLAEFNRPFAHRTFQAMLAYMANYPKIEGLDDNQRIRQALADQIGMRIMPKLRGVELSQNRRTLEEIQGILADGNRLNDRLLLTAFENAINVDKGNGFFRWNGFDW